jgi:hypothetical protein
MNLREGNQQGRRRARRPLLERLERRRVLTVFAVTTTGDGGAGSLR